MSEVGEGHSGRGRDVCNYLRLDGAYRVGKPLEQSVRCTLCWPVEPVHESGLLPELWDATGEAQGGQSVRSEGLRWVKHRLGPFPPPSQNPL